MAEPTSSEPQRGAPAGDNTQVVRTCCPAHNCGGRCLLLAHVRDGRIVRLEADDRSSDEIADPRLVACTRGRSYLRRRSGNRRRLNNRLCRHATDAHRFLAFMNLDLGDRGFFQQLNQLFNFTYIHIKTCLMLDVTCT